MSPILLHALRFLALGLFLIIGGIWILCLLAKDKRKQSGANPFKYSERYDSRDEK